MNRNDFKELSRLRIREVRALLKSNSYPGAYYLLGYSVECALKACICKQVERYDFPDKKLANAAHTHDLENLVRIAGIDTAFQQERQSNADLDVNWAVVKDWSESRRYDYSITEAQATQLYKACTDRNGVLPWIRRRW